MTRTVKEPMETVQVRLPGTVLAWIDRYRNSKQIPPTRSETIRHLVEQGGKAVQVRTRVPIDDE